MPYFNEKANKFSHERIVNNQVVRKALSRYKITFDVELNNHHDFRNKFIANELGDQRLIDYIFTVDSSYMQIPVNEEIPSAKIGIVNFSSSIIDLVKKSEVYEKGFINPRKFNDIYNAKMLTFICPTHNVVLDDDRSSNLLDCIREEVYSFYINSSPFSEISLLDSLFKIISSYSADIEIKCPNDDCPSNNKDTLYSFTKNKFNLEEIGINPQKCKHCGKEIYLTDYLRLHEAVDLEFGNSTILTRFAQATEHIININFIDFLLKHKSYSLISKTAFIIDGPLAIYGEPAKLSRCIQNYLYAVSNKIESEIVYFGIMKTGRLKDHFCLLARKMQQEQIELTADSYLLVDDEYRFKYIQKAPKENKYFGQGVLFGQDFLFYSKDKKRFIVSVLYPAKSRESNFAKRVFDYSNYLTLGTVLRLLNNISLDLYEDAILPIALAHKYAAISLNPGSNIIEKFIKKNLE